MYLRDLCFSWLNSKHYSRNHFASTNKLIDKYISNNAINLESPLIDSILSFFFFKVIYYVNYYFPSFRILLISQQITRYEIAKIKVDSEKIKRFVVN